jgi:glycerol-3-phosphate dehydrogenase
MIEHAIRNNPTITLDDLRRDVRLGMGPCQGGFCTYRAACILHALTRKGEAPAQQGKTERAEEITWEVAYMQSPAHNTTPGVEERALPLPSFDANLLLRDFLQERWKGLTPILWGQQLKQECLDELIYLSLLNVDHLPDDGATSPLTDFYHYSPPQDDPQQEAKDA